MVDQRGGKRLTLDVIDGNLPAFTLYQQLGFEHYSSSVDLEFKPENLTAESLPEPVLPAGYACAPLEPFDWRSRMELEQRISPPGLLKYEPIEERRFRRPGVMRLLRPVLLAAEGTYDEDYILRTVEDGQIVGRYGYSASRRGKGLNQVRLALDPAHAALAAYMVASALRGVLHYGPGLRVECTVPQWNEALLEACEAAGFQQRVAYCRMGMVL
ncbi:MAG: hypothetical protein AB1894_21355 [Chloroflexota bacterium]